MISAGWREKEGKAIPAKIPEEVNPRTLATAIPSIVVYTVYRRSKPEDNQVKARYSCPAQ
jgi:hypothetical protein